MIRKQITSSSDPDDSLPWYEMDLSNAPPEITTDNDGGTDADTAKTTIEAIGEVDPDDPKQNVVYAVTVAGKYICYPQGRNLTADGISLRAHLAWYDAENDEFTILEFVES